MGSTCNELVDACLRDGDSPDAHTRHGGWPDALLDRAIAEDEGRALLSVVVERLGDLFEPRL